MKLTDGNKNQNATDVTSLDTGTADSVYSVTGYDLSGIIDASTRSASCKGEFSKVNVSTPKSRRRDEVRRINQYIKQNLK